MINGINPSQPFPNPAELEASLFPQTSRYFGKKILKHRRADGREVAYLERRFLPDEEELEEIRLHTVAEGERLDLLAHHYLGDSTAFWRILDANDGALDPDELETIGRQLKIARPEGFPGGRNA